jgi:hypothetical protein
MRGNESNKCFKRVLHLFPVENAPEMAQLAREPDPRFLGNSAGRGHNSGTFSKGKKGQICNSDAL